MESIKSGKSKKSTLSQQDSPAKLKISNFSKIDFVTFTNKHINNELNISH